MTLYFVKILPAEESHMGINIYEGFMLGNVRHGLGRYKWADGHVTIGEWNNGECSAFKAEWQRQCDAKLPL